MSKVLAGAFAIILATAGISLATQVSHTLTITGEYNGTTGAQITTNATTATTDFTNGVANIYRISINSLLTGLGANQTYGGELFDLTLSGSAARAPQVSGTGSKANYLGSSPALPAGATDANSVPVTGSVLGTDADEGTSTTDLLAITTVINETAVGGLFDASSNPLADPRTTFGVGTAASIGTVYVNFASNGAKLTFGNSTYINYDYSVDGGGNSTGSLESTPVATGGASLTFVSAPEPATLVLFGLGGLGLVAAARRRRSA